MCDRSNSIIELKNLTKCYAKEKVIDNIGFRINEGEVFGIIGPDGAGKTTLLRLLAGVITLTEGSAQIFGYDLISEIEKIKEICGYAPQIHSIYGDLTVSENIDFFADVYLIPREEEKARKKELLEITNLNPFENRLARNLSGGMKQKLALICTLIHRPKMLLLDEPTTGLDPLVRRDFWNLIKKISGKTTVLVSTAYLNEANFCDRVAFIYKGKVVACDSPANFKKEGDLEEVFRKLIERKD